MRPTAIAVLLGLLSACTADGPYSAVDPHLETTTHASSIHTAGRGPQSQTRIRAIVIDAPQSRSCTLLTYVVRSDLNFPKIKAVRSHGRPLAYRRIDRHRAGRLRAEAGTIAMSCSAFTRLTAPATRSDCMVQGAPMTRLYRAGSFPKRSRRLDHASRTRNRKRSIPPPCARV